ncbi:MAG: 2-C-methyl-D-erythritol 4-phosphate cytidylyltransferase [Bacteroidetes bacterium]|nr:2-C-methyl-D-erythritol 4-phosphate cytidylyltransferase [Bacteroidota bacterium]
MDKFAIIVAGGTGTRMSSAIPKQFLPLAGKPVLMHSIQAFHEYDAKVKIIVALPTGLISEWKTLCSRYSFTIPHTLAQSGKVRFDSVKNALSFVKLDGIVAIHDGVRPMISKGLISRAYDHAIAHDNAIPVTPVTDSVRMTNGNMNHPVDRSHLRLIQTPQVFLTSLILKAYQQGYQDSFTDDASVLEAAGETINLIRGDPYNIKITYPEDLVIAEALIKYKTGV